MQTKDITVIFSGNKHYAFKKTRELAKMGYHIVKEKRWSDGKYTFTMCLPMPKNG